MTNTERTELLTRAIRVYGEPAQVDMAIEEMSELTKALCKVKRAHGGPETMAAVSSVTEEIADVQIMLDQLRIIFGSDTSSDEEAKLTRLAGRLEKATAGRCCENCGNTRCSSSPVAFLWDECVASGFTRNWTPKKEEGGEIHG